jgi:hypothetical protein
MNKPPPGDTTTETLAKAMPLPQHWSAEQALAVWEYLEDLAGLIWARYERQLIALLRPDDPDPGDTAQLDLFDPDDDIPF